MALYRETATGFLCEYASNPGAGYTAISAQPTDTVANRVTWWRGLDTYGQTTAWHPSEYRSPQDPAEAALSIQFTREAAFISADASGTVTDAYLGANTEVRVYRGTSDVTITEGWTLTKVEDGCTSTLTEAGGVYTLQITNIPLLATKQGYVRITATRVGVTVVRDFNFIKVFAGQTGPTGPQGPSGDTGPQGTRGSRQILVTTATGAWDDTTAWNGIVSQTGTDPVLSDLVTIAKTDGTVANSKFYSGGASPGTWTTPTAYINGSLLVTGTVGANQLAAGSITADRLAAGTITAASGVIGSIDASKITTGTLSANYISGGTINGSLVNVTNLNATNITTGTLNGVLVGSGVSGTVITTGTLNASLCNVTNLNASNITGGTLSANYISGGTINGSNVTITNLNASNITGGTLSANYISGGTINGSNVTITNLNASNISTGTLSANYISGGTINGKNIYLTNGTIRTSNYASGNTGWAIDGNGNAEFNTIIVRNPSKNIQSGVLSKSIKAYYPGNSVAVPSNTETKIVEYLYTFANEPGAKVSMSFVLATECPIDLTRIAISYDVYNWNTSTWTTNGVFERIYDRTGQSLEARHICVPYGDFMYVTASRQMYVRIWVQHKYSSSAYFGDRILLIQECYA